ncbi:ribonuclease III [Candidatus Magnetomonas plexicatena]|uniref:ribonuclease III n=1 Tax=Candidatus Magnetomonas plexicatena TaxID=2552947 RepID=UPI001C73F88B|nr:ribonuclease III [Nitrospirales bacterium LBB_01]
MLEEALGYYFVNKKLLEEAITHRSYYHECSDKSRKYNERIEFLGDSVLGLAITEALFNEAAIFTESEMSKMKSYLVSKKMLHRIAIGLNLGSYLRLGKGEELTGGREKASLLANSMEAIIGAVFLDSDYDKAKEVVLNLYKKEIEELVVKQRCFDYKTELQELGQKLYAELPEYVLAAEAGTDHEKSFTYEVRLNGRCFGTGEGKNKKSAQSEAARAALEAIKDVVVLIQKRDEKTSVNV